MHPLAILRKMVKMNTEPMFIRQSKGRTSRHWDGVLLSAGGNDLIAALERKGGGCCGSRPTAAQAAGVGRCRAGS